jgi:hypothetical protein
LTHLTHLGQEFYWKVPIDPTPRFLGGETLASPHWRQACIPFAAVTGGWLGTNGSLDRITFSLLGGHLNIDYSLLLHDGSTAALFRICFTELIRIVA